MTMIRKLLPPLLGLLGLSLGAGAGYFLRPAPDATAKHQDQPQAESAHEDPAHAVAGSKAAHGSDAGAVKDYAKLANQFIIPVLVNGNVSALMVLSLSLEVTAGATADVDAAEPKLRDAFLQVLFDHANSGGFDGSYTDTANLVVLRTALLEAAKPVLGEKVTDVLITDILRRDG